MPPKKNRFWQLTIIAEDSLLSHDELTAELIEHGFKINKLPMYLKLHDVEAMEIGDKPISIKPLPSDLKQETELKNFGRTKEKSPCNQMREPRFKCSRRNKN